MRGHHDIRSMQSGVRAEICHDAIFKAIERWPERPAITPWNVRTVVNRADHAWGVANGAQVAIAIHRAEPAWRVFQCFYEGGFRKLPPGAERVVNGY